MLPENFEFSRFGITSRLVTEDDAKTIVALRSNPDRTKYMVTLEPSVEKQKEWIKEYKKRERKGEDYYFICHDNTILPIGLFRISHIDYVQMRAKYSSLITIINNKAYGIKISIIRSIIAFDVLDLETIYGDVHNDNNRAKNILKLLGFTFKDTDTSFVDVYNNKEGFHKALQNEELQKLIKK